MAVQIYIRKKCPDCDGHGYVRVEDEHGRELGREKCPNPACRTSSKMGYILIKKERRE